MFGAPTVGVWFELGNNPMRCAYCNMELQEPEEKAAQMCSICADKGHVSEDDLREKRRKRAAKKCKRDAEQDHDPKPDRLPWQPSQVLVTMVSVVAAWIVLALLSLVQPWAAWWLVGIGTCTLLTGICWAYWKAAQNGIEFREFIPVFGGIRLFLAFVQIAIMPLFTLIYLFIDTEEAWPPLATQLVGIGMIATGVFFLR